MIKYSRIELKRDISLKLQTRCVFAVMNRFIITCSSFALLFLVLPVIHSQCQSLSKTDTKFSRIDSLFLEWNTSDAPGCSTTILEKGEVIFQENYGMANVKEKVPITEHTVFNLASCSKQFTAMCIQLLHEKGKLSLEDNIQKYLPELNFAKPVKIKHLIAHTSGIRDYLSLLGMTFELGEKSMTRENIKELLVEYNELNFDPGSRFVYSNSGYFILGLLVERISGLTLREYAEQNIFSPLGMNSTFFHDQKNEPVNDLAIGYRLSKGNMYKKDMWDEDVVGDHNLHSTMADMVKWAKNFLDNQLGERGKELIDTCLEPGLLSNGKVNDYTHGLFFDEYNNYRIYGHGGSSNGYKAQFIHIPEKEISIIFLSNINATSPTNKVNDVVSILLDSRNEEHEVSQGNKERWAGNYIEPFSKEILPIKYADQNLYYNEETNLTSINSSTYRFNSGTKLFFHFDSTLQQKFVKISYTPYQSSAFYAIDASLSDPEDRSQFEGVFESDNPTLKFRIKEKNGQLRIKYQKIEGKYIVSIVARFIPLQMKSISKDLAFVPNGAVTLEFKRISSGAIEGVYFHGQRLTNLYFKKVH